VPSPTPSVSATVSASEIEGMVYDMAVVQEYRPLSQFDNNVKAALLANTKNAKVFVPKMFFSEEVLPDDHEDIYGFIGDVVGKTSKSDKVAMDVLFGDGATTPFYMNKHPKAKEGLKDVYLKNPKVLFLLTADQFASEQSQSV
jgi:hypothetical protein